MRIPEPQTEQVEINQFIDSIFPLLQELCIKKEIEIKYSRSQKTCFLLIDKEQITQVLINLVKNAVEAFQSENGTINIKSEITEDKISLSISDNGVGISKEVLSEIFIPFFTTKKEGSGIGLSISRQIIRNHGGELRITSEQNKGTNSELVLPLLNIP